MQFLRGLACEQGQGYGVSRKQAPIWATSGEGECENSRMRERGYYAVWIVGHGVCGFAFMSTISLRLIVPPGLILPPSGQTPEPTPYPPTPPPGTPYPLGGRPTAYPPYCTLASCPECRPSLQGDLRRLHEAGSSGSAATHPYDTPLPATTTPLSRVAVCGVWQTQGRRQTLPPLPPTPSPTPTLADCHPTLPTPPPTPYPPPGRV